MPVATLDRRLGHDAFLDLDQLFPTSVTITRTSEEDWKSRQLVVSIDGKPVGELLWGDSVMCKARTGPAHAARPQHARLANRPVRRRSGCTDFLRSRQPRRRQYVLSLAGFRDRPAVRNHPEDELGAGCGLRDPGCEGGMRDGGWGMRGHVAHRTSHVSRATQAPRPPPRAPRPPERARRSRSCRACRRRCGTRDSATAPCQ